MAENNLNDKKYWASLEELHNEPSFIEMKGKEFLSPPEEQTVTELHRREFLKLMGAGLLLTTTACYRKPVEKIIPYVNKPEEITPGVANWYASTCMECPASCGTLVKTKEGRPLKIEGNRDHPLSQGGLCARGQASILNLYDPDRLKNPVKMSSGSPQKISCEDLDNEIKKKLDAIKNLGGKIFILTGVDTSPTTKKLINEFLAGYPGSRHVSYDPLVPEEIAIAQELSYGERLIPNYQVDQARLIVSFGADFLGTYLSPVEFAKNYSRGRRPEKGVMSRLVSIESALSLTGTNADEYFAVKTGDELLVALSLAHEIIVHKKRSSYAGNTEIAAALAPYPIDRISMEAGIPGMKLKALAQELWKARGKGLVFGGAQKCKQAVRLQVVVNLLNSALENDGTTVNWTKPVNRGGESYKELTDMIETMKKGEASALLMANINPAWTFPSSLEFKSFIQKIPLVVSFTDRIDETARLAHYIMPVPHSLESWNDANPIAGVYSLVQPTIAPLHDTRSFQETLLLWSGTGSTTWHDYLKNNWQQNIYNLSDGKSFEAFWEETLQKGVYQNRPMEEKKERPFLSEALKKLTDIKTSPVNLSLALYPSVALFDGKSANNAWLQELPDPISKITWDNYLSMAPLLAREKGFEEGDIVRVSTENYSAELPAHIQPKLNAKTVMAAVGYGRTNAGSIGNGVGVDAYPFQQMHDGFVQWNGLTVKSLVKTGKKARLATTQGHHTVEGRPIIQETTFSAFQKDPHSGEEPVHPVPSLWPEHQYKGYRWGMAIDMSSCIGCNGCMVGCQSENNVPVVGKEQVLIGRDMHWLRIDRYYKGDENQPEVNYQPMLCQHCENAPCETVCPVIATVHSEEGLNEQIYNRCVGTRYCANNCPYKVRRFNYYDYWKDIRSPTHLALSPDITTRSRGVMEKCTFCMQRIRDAKDKAKDEEREVKDGEIQTACQQSCPTDAIVFGNLNDPESRVSKLKKSARGYHVLEDLNVKPQVTYLRKVRNKEA